MVFRAGEQGFEPQISRPERDVLPLHHSPIRRVFYHLIWQYLAILGNFADVQQPLKCVAEYGLRDLLTRRAACVILHVQQD